jgi:hypothetical protein
VISYLEAVKELVDPGIYSRGVRYFLEGSVSSYEEMTLDYWRLYKVIGNKEYLIKFPLLHLALSQKKFNQAAQAITESVECSCDFYLEHGICKHIVAVCASLDQEFSLNLAKTKTKIAKKESSNLLETIFEADKIRQIRQFEIDFEQYLESSKSTNFRWLEDFTLAVIDTPSEYEEFLKHLKIIVHKYLIDFDKERKILKLIPKTLIYGKKVWWDFWYTNFDEINQNKLYDLWTEIWEIKMLNMAGEFEKDIIAQLLQMDDQNKAVVLEKLQAKFTFNKNFWLEFVFVSKYWQWFEENLNSLDPQYLLRIAQVWPEKQDQIEYIILAQAKVWADFLQPGQYQEIIDLFRGWEDKIGRTENFERALDYYKDLHGKKKTLLKDLGIR